ncbi:MAG: hypothetical protein K9L59_18645 [Desulfobacterales bacterium]|nr:hypothetical protein [Desulfobacterales bacterium]
MNTALSNPISPESEFDIHKRALQEFQAMRLESTYADLKQDPEYREFGRFFFEEIYGPEDFSFRDASIRKLHGALKGKVHKGVVAAVDRVLEFQELSEDLDERMTAEMIETGAGPELTMDQYREIYRSLDNYNQRLYQIDLAMEVTRDFFHLSRKWMIGVSLKTARSAANLIGLGRIMDFVHQGYTALQTISEIEPFIGTVRRRERAFNDEIFRVGR